MFSMLLLLCQGSAKWGRGWWTTRPHGPIHLLSENRLKCIFWECIPKFPASVEVCKAKPLVEGVLTPSIPQTQRDLDLPVPLEQVRVTEARLLPCFGTWLTCWADGLMLNSCEEAKSSKPGSFSSAPKR